MKHKFQLFNCGIFYRYDLLVNSETHDFQFWKLRFTGSNFIHSILYSSNLSLHKEI